MKQFSLRSILIILLCVLILSATPSGASTSCPACAAFPGGMRSASTSGSIIALGGMGLSQLAGFQSQESLMMQQQLQMYSAQMLSDKNRQSQLIQLQNALAATNAQVTKSNIKTAQTLNQQISAQVLGLSGYYSNMRGYSNVFFVQNSMHNGASSASTSGGASGGGGGWEHGWI